MKYFNLIKDGEKTNTIIAVDSEKEDIAQKKFADEGYELEECERPIDAHVLPEEPCFNPAPLVLHNIDIYANPFQNARKAIYNGPNCARCANRFRRSDFCNSHYYSNDSCYRFKLEK